MRIRLLNVQFSDPDRYPYSLPVLQLEAVLRTHQEELGFPIVVDRLQLSRSELPLRAAMRAAEAEPDVLVAYVESEDWPLLAPVCEAVVRLVPTCDVLVAGPGVRGVESELLRVYSFVQLVIGAEPEVALFEAIAGLNRRRSFAQYRFHDVLGIALRSESGEPELTLERPAIEPLDLLPSPYSSFPEPLITLAETAVYETSRGCRFHCTLCNWGGVFKRRRGYSMERISADIAAIDAAGCASLTLTDALFNDDPQRTLEVLEVVNAARHIRRLSAYVRPDRFTEELHRAFDAKIWHFVCGIFSSNGETLAALKREIDLDVARQNLERLIAAGHGVTLQVVGALPREGLRELAQSLDWALAIRGARIRLVPLRIVSGTELELHHEGLGLIRGPSSLASRVLATPELNAAEVLRVSGVDRLLRWLEDDPPSSDTLRGLIARHFGSQAEALFQFWGHLEQVGVERELERLDATSVAPTQALLRDELQRFAAGLGSP